MGFFDFMTEDIAIDLGGFTQGNRTGIHLLYTMEKS